ncbi:SusC/RagA family TonB-linked outer membrane protein [Paracnuella aquatica]|uniref:SusC/RagA family TonB-linked outer membrane protein n=1 Tax=Paracnuella aquatica TaxID=2268757 RepID=UPI00139031A3|nr:TonB-dependent receptor [Paracnuella aquatica]
MQQCIVVFVCLITTSAFAQERFVSGIVLSKDEHTPVPGASVVAKGLKVGTTTDKDGKFSLKLPASSTMLVFTIIGYDVQEVPVSNESELHVELAAKTRQLNEVVVTGYSTQRKKEYTGAAARISGQEIADRPVPSFDQALAGQAAGVSITSNGGALNAAPVFRIRGINSIQLSSYPLVVIDGITAFTGDVGNTAQNNPLADLNPADIESIDILKDASATAIYGSRAANGVVVITTKKGKKGKAKVSYDGWVGVNKTPRLPQVLNAEEYVLIKNEALANVGSAPAYGLQQMPDGSPLNTNWYDFVYQTGKSHNHNVSISGANDATSYFVSLGYSDQEGFMVRNTFERKSIRLNLDHKLTNNITIGTNSTFSNSINSNLTSGINSSFALNNLARMAMVLPPNLSPFNEDGSYNVVGNSIGYGPNKILTGYYNLMPMVEHDEFTSEGNNFLGAAYFEWELIKGLKLKTIYSINNLNVENRSFNNPYQAGGFANNGSATNSMNKNRRTGWTNTLNYATTFGADHSLSALLGHEDIKTSTNSWGVTRQNLTDRYFDTFEGGYAQVTGSSGSRGQNGFRSYFSNANYAFKKKYLLSASFRRDGFSGLANGHKFGNFGGGSVGWNISDETFFQNSFLSGIISSLKLRGSYGQVGNVNIGDFPALALYASGIYAGIPTLAPSQTGNADLRWETSKKTDIGVNMSFLNGRITVDADYYHNNIDGMILDARQAPSKGIPGNSITSNVGSMYNNGFEFSINAQLVNTKDVRWNADFNITTLKNRVTELANDNADIWSSGLETSNITRVGEPVGAVYVVKTTGVNPANGLRTYLNRNGEEVQYNPVGSKWTYLHGAAASALDAYGDGYVLGSSIPTYFGGLNTTLVYKGLDLYLGFTYSGGNKMYNGTKATLMDNRFFNNQKDILRRWTTPGQVTDVPKLHYNDQYASGSVLMHSGNVEDGGFIKLRNVSLGYRISASAVSKIGLSSIRLYAAASNFILYTKYTGSDPEISANGDSNTASGRDKNAVPAGQSFTLGLNLGF